MPSKQSWLAALVIFGIMICCVSCRKDAGDREVADQDQVPAPVAEGTSYGDLLVSYLRAHFDDLHDVTMRFHDQDPALNGMIEIKEVWENRVLKEAEIVRNDTGSEDLGDALIEKMRSWDIDGLLGPFETVIPIQVKIVGLDDPEFPNTAILTGEVRDTEGAPLQGVMVVIKPAVAGMVYRAETNREGIFVRTLIPPGTWDIEYSLQGYVTVEVPGVRLSAGKHVRESVILQKK
jgi:hypothetical protein